MLPRLNPSRLRVREELGHSCRVGVNGSWTEQTTLTIELRSGLTPFLVESSRTPYSRKHIPSTAQAVPLLESMQQIQKSIDSARALFRPPYPR
jgi:hypothetical protein